MREALAATQLPADVNNYGVIGQKGHELAAADAVAVLAARARTTATSWPTTPTSTWWTNCARAPGVGDVLVYGGRYAMQIWVKPDQLAKLQVTVPEIVRAIREQNTVNPAGQIGGEPVPAGQEFTYTVRAQGRLITPEEFGEIVLRANRDGSVLRVSDVARVELGAESYNVRGRVERPPGGRDPGVPVAGIERARCGQGGARRDGRTEAALPRRRGLPGFARHHAARDARASARS